MNLPQQVNSARTTVCGTRFSGPRGISPKLLFHGAGSCLYHGEYRLPREIHENVLISRGKGFDSRSNQEFVRFLGYAVHSATEVQSHLYVALDQEYVPQDQFDAIYQQAVQVKNLLHGFIRYLRKSKPWKED